MAITSREPGDHLGGEIVAAVELGLMLGGEVVEALD
jgi:hypothetical protein